MSEEMKEEVTEEVVVRFESREDAAAAIKKRHGLEGADLSGLDLSEMKITGLNAEGINFSGANLTNSVLAGLNLEGVDLNSRRQFGGCKSTRCTIARCKY